MKNLKIGKKILVSFSVAIMTSIILMVMSTFSIGRIGNMVTELYVGPYVAATSAMSYGRDIVEIEATLYRALAERDYGKYESTINELSEEAMANLERVKESSHGKEFKSLGQLDTLSGVLKKTRTDVQDLMKAGKWDAAKEKMIGSYAQALNGATNATADLCAEAEENVAKYEKDAVATKQVTIVTQIVIFIGLLAVTLFTLFRLIKGIKKPLEELEVVASGIAQGNLEHEITYESKDEIGSLAQSFRQTCDSLNTVITDLRYLMDEMADGNFNIHTTSEESYVGDFNPILQSIRKMNRNLSSTLTQINESADQVASGSDQVSSGAQGLSQGATEQASSVEELAATINEISNMVSESAEHARQASGQVSRAGDEISVSNQSMNEMMEAMAEITQKSNEIGKIIKTIEDIAFQTNILALNAAVEAARAGEAGKGFAVVADEVRNLASKSAEAANNTTHLIEGAIHAVESGTKIAKHTAETLAATVESAASAVTTVEKISEAAEHQAESIQQVTQGVDQISSVVQTNSATAEQSAAASEELSGQAQILKELVSKFKLREMETGAVKKTVEESVHEPIYKEPAYEEPLYDEPLYEEPIYEEPLAKEPVFEPKIEQPKSSFKSDYSKY